MGGVLLGSTPWIVEQGPPLVGEGQRPLQWPPTLAASWGPRPHPGSCSLQGKEMSLLATAGLGIPNGEFTWTPREPNLSINSLKL